MSELDPLLQNVSALSAFTVALVALAGITVGIAPSSFPLLSVAAGMAAGQGPPNAGRERTTGFWLAMGFALGIASMDALLGALFGFAGFAVMRTLARLLAPAYATLGVIMAVSGLALLRVIRVVVPVLAPRDRPARSFLGSYLLGLPFGLSTCPACTPLLLPVVAAAASTGDPFMGAVLMFTFGVARGIPIVLAGTLAGLATRLRHTRRFVVWVERIGGALLLAAALYFFYQAGVYAGWLPPL
jgi:cytochrome c-type biogenesis protein